MASSDNSRSTRPRVRILGGGFAGVGAAQKLKDADTEVVLVDRDDYHTSSRRRALLPTDADRRRSPTREAPQ